MFGSKIKKTIFIEGMNCGHCSKRVEEALKSLHGVKSVSVNVENKKADVALKKEIDDENLKKAVEDVGFEVTNIE